MSRFPLSCWLLLALCGCESAGPRCQGADGRYEAAVCLPDQTDLLGLEEEDGQLRAVGAVCQTMRMFCSHDGRTRLHEEVAGPAFGMCGAPAGSAIPEGSRRHTKPYCDLATPNAKPSCVSFPCDGVVYRVTPGIEPEATSPRPSCVGAATLPSCGAYAPLEMVDSEADFFGPLRFDPWSERFTIAAVCTPPALDETYECPLEAGEPMLARCEAGVPSCPDGQTPYCASLACH